MNVWASKTVVIIIQYTPYALKYIILHKENIAYDNHSFIIISEHYVQYFELMPPKIRGLRKYMKGAET